MINLMLKMYIVATFKQFGNGGSALSAIAIAALAFISVVAPNLITPRRGAMIVGISICSILTFLYLWTLIPAVTIKGYYGSTG